MLSQNGWSVVTPGSAELITETIPGTSAKFLGGVRRGPFSVIALYIGSFWNQHIEPVQNPGCWGYAFRSIRGQTSGYSNHASGTAIDINAPKHPLGTRTLTGAQRAQLARLQDILKGTVRFGAFYSGRVDEMHAEQSAGVSDARMFGILTDIRAGRLPDVPRELLADPGVLDPGQVGADGSWPVRDDQQLDDNLGSRYVREYVGEWQRLLGTRGYPVEVDWDWGPKTSAATKRWERDAARVVDGRVSLGDWFAMQNNPYPKPPTPSAPPAYPGLLQDGSKGAAVEQLQRRLNEHRRGAGEGLILVDGDFGSGTESVVRWFQDARKLGADGVVGPRTWASLWQ